MTRRDAGFATAGLLGVSLLAGLLAMREPVSPWPTATARSETFIDTIVETGTVTAQRLMLYSSTIPGASAKLIELVPEGTAVREGDLLARFDSAGFEQSRARELAALRQAQAEASRARELARLEILSVEEERTVALQAVDKAESGLENQVSGRGAVDVTAAEVEAADAARELQQARTTFEDMKPLLAEGFITRAELERAEQAMRRAEDRQRLAAAKVEALVRFQRPAETRRAEAELNAAREGVSRQGSAAIARFASHRAAVSAADGKVSEIQARIAILDEQIARAIIRAQGPGLVVYRELFFGNDQRKPQIGDEIFPNQSLIALPDSSQLSVETRVRELDLHKIAASQAVRVRVDAYPDLELPASVGLVGALAQEDPARAGTKFFPVNITLTSSDARLRTGMTARVEIQVSAFANAITLPSQAIFDAGEGPYVVVRANGQPERRPVTLRAQGETTVAVAGGVKPGDVVLLVDPTSR